MAKSSQTALCACRLLIHLFVLLTWLLTGCDRSDPIVVIQLHPKNPDILYVATNDYIYKSRDGGQTWTNLSKGMSHSRVIAMAVDPVYPATIYAGTKGEGVLRSDDRGRTWQAAGLAGHDVKAIAVSRVDAQMVD